MPPCQKIQAFGAVVALALLTLQPGHAQTLPHGAQAVSEFVGAFCKSERPAGADLAATFKGARVLTNEPISFRGQAVGWRAVLRLKDGSEIEASRIAPGGRLRRFAVEYAAPPRAAGAPALPALFVMAGSDCRIAHGRKLIRDARGHPLSIGLLNRDLHSIGQSERLDAPVPPGKDPGGVMVAMIDSGVNYLLPAIAARLARDKAGQILGHDYWDDDPRPLDADTSRSPFLPLWHGTRVASVLLREAPGARIVPYRYPRHDMVRFQDLVEAADKHGVRIVAMTLGGPNRDYWLAFEEAARARPHMLFIVSAGNNGADIDSRPIYPAAMDLPNILTVTSSEANGKLARGSNWGKLAVDIMVPAEHVQVTRFSGARATASGTSFAVPRVAALAARLLEKNPDWKAPDLKAAILARAVPSPEHAVPVTRHGWIPTPSTD